MSKVWEILIHPDHPKALVKLANYQWNVYGTRLDILIAEERSVNIEARYPSLDQIDKTMRERPRQKRGKGW